MLRAFLCFLGIHPKEAVTGPHFNANFSYECTRCGAFWGPGDP